MKILLIGNGFVASSLVHRLEQSGHELLIYSRTVNNDLSSRQIEGDIFDFQNFVKVFSWKPQVIVHTAWITTPGVYRNDPSNLDYANFTINLANHVRNSEVQHLIILGTCAEYGSQIGPSTAGITKLLPNNLYSKEKVAAFTAVNELLLKSDTRLTWARLFYPYGPHQHEKRLIPFLVHAIKNSNPIHLEDISSVYDWITIRDVSSAILWAIDHQLPIEIDIGTSVGTTNLELLSVLMEMLPTEKKQITLSNHDIGKGEVFVMGENSPLLKSGWLPKDTLRTGLEWVLEN
jgi:nucleoside-diphosphate-sugar epimerase